MAETKVKWYNEPSFIYALGYPDGPTKIGHSGTPRTRLLAYRKKDGADIELLQQWETIYWHAQILERYVHWELRHRHINAEWFNATVSEISPIVERGLTLPLQELGPLPPVYLNRNTLPERHIALFKAGTFDRIAALVGMRNRNTFIGEAVENELARREADGPGRLAAE